MILNTAITREKERERKNTRDCLHYCRKRVLRLELNDGHRTVPAMEYRPISCLHTKLPPGTKISITGPIRCINGVLFLESKNVRLLGGEISSMAIENAYENVLRKCLDLAINKNPLAEYTGNGKDFHPMMKRLLSISVTSHPLQRRP